MDGGIHDEVGHQLRKCAGVHLHRKVAFDLELQAASGALDHRRQRSGEGGQELRRLHLAAVLVRLVRGHVLEAAHQIGRALEVGHDQIEGHTLVFEVSRQVFVHQAMGPQVGQDVLRRLRHVGGRRQGDAQRVVDLVRHASHQDPQRLQLLGLLNLRHHLLALGLRRPHCRDVDLVAHKVVGPPGCAAHGEQGQPVPEGLTIGPVVQHFSGPGPALAHSRPQGRAHGRVGVRPLEKTAVAAHDLLGAQAGHGIESRVGIDQRKVGLAGVGNGHPEGRAVHHRAQQREFVHLLAQLLNRLPLPLAGGCQVHVAAPHHLRLSAVQAHGVHRDHEHEGHVDRQVAEVRQLHGLHAGHLHLLQAPHIAQLPAALGGLGVGVVAGHTAGLHDHGRGQPVRALAHQSTTLAGEDFGLPLPKRLQGLGLEVIQAGALGFALRKGVVRDKAVGDTVLGVGSVDQGPQLDGQGGGNGNPAVHLAVTLGQHRLPARGLQPLHHVGGVVAANAGHDAGDLLRPQPHLPAVDLAQREKEGQGEQHDGQRKQGEHRPHRPLRSEEPTHVRGRGAVARGRCVARGCHTSHVAMRNSGWAPAATRPRGPIQQRSLPNQYRRRA